MMAINAWMVLVGPYRGQLVREFLFCVDAISIASVKTCSFTLCMLCFVAKKSCVTGEGL